jgi:protein SCO1/2
MLAALLSLAVSCREHSTTNASFPGTNLQTFFVRGVIRELKPDRQTVIIKHEAISNYMDAMTMPFHAKKTNTLMAMQPGDEITFRLHVTKDESWIDGVTRLATSQLSSPLVVTNNVASVPARHPLLNYAFTNELGQRTSLGQFRGQALAYTFFFTRCPIPEYCPRLSKNFAEASAQLRQLPTAPTNWHFLSISIDPEFDNPAMLRSYARRYNYDPDHWSFLTGPTNKIRELAELSGLPYERENGTYTHGFRTTVIDARGRLQALFPISGNLSDALVAEMLKAAAATNQ